MWCVLSIRLNTFYNAQSRHGEPMVCGMDMACNIASHDLWPLFFLHFIRQHSVMCWMHSCQELFEKSTWSSVFLYRASLCFLFSCSLLCEEVSNNYNCKNASVSAKLNVEGVSRRWGALLLKYELLCKKRMQTSGYVCISQMEETHLETSLMWIGGGTR